MANIKSAKDRIKTAKRDLLKNVSVKTKIKTYLKNAESAISGKSADVKALVSKAVKVIDTAVSQGVLHKNTASRKKSRLMKKAKK
ncbi:MAG: 30S ribosomal protein S20 [Candidatus Margulisiibacteriota bacterium]|jgi:small subunit ribosomal protein S20